MATVETLDDCYMIDGKRYDRVHTALAQKQKHALLWWAADCAHKQAVDVVTEACATGADPRLALVERQKEIVGAHNKMRDKAANRGTDVHKIAAQILSHDEAEHMDWIPDDALATNGSEIFTDAANEIMGFGDAILEACKEIGLSGMRSRRVEEVIMSPRHGYAGRVDCITRSHIVDWKTCRDEKRATVYPEHALQLAAYNHATHYAYSGEKITRVGSRKGVIVHLWAGGYKITEVPCGKDEHAAFLALLKVARWEATKKTEDENAE